MKKIVWTNGLIAGVIISVFMVSSIAVCYGSSNFEGNAFFGFASMIAAFSFVFVGVRKYRNTLGNGFISFGKALKIGLYISLIASTMYVITWCIDYYIFIPDFMERYTAHLVEQVRSSGSSKEEALSKIKDHEHMKELYRNPLMVILFTYGEILPVGIVVSLISAFILKKKVL